MRMAMVLLCALIVTVKVSSLCMVTSDGSSPAGIYLSDGQKACYNGAIWVRSWVRLGGLNRNNRSFLDVPSEVDSS